MLVEVPREECSVVPQKKCRKVSKILPSLQVETKCVRVPKEVCATSRLNPRRVRRPVVRTWCQEREGEAIFCRFFGFRLPMFLLLFSVAVPDPFSKLVVVGGFDGSSWHRDIRVLDLALTNKDGNASSPSSSSSECARLPDLPLRGLNSGGASAYIGGRAVVCGGATVACFYLEDGRWKRTSYSLPAIRVFPTTITM